MKVISELRHCNHLVVLRLLPDGYYEVESNAPDVTNNVIVHTQSLHVAMADFQIQVENTLRAAGAARVQLFVNQLL